MIEIDKTRQVLIVANNGHADWVFNASSGSDHPYVSEGVRYTAHTPEGNFNVIRVGRRLRQEPARPAVPAEVLHEHRDRRARLHRRAAVSGLARLRPGLERRDRLHLGQQRACPSAPRCGSTSDLERRSRAGAERTAGMTGGACCGAATLPLLPGPALGPEVGRCGGAARRVARREGRDAQPGALDDEEGRVQGRREEGRQARRGQEGRARAKKAAKKPAAKKPQKSQEARESRAEEAPRRSPGKKPVKAAAKKAAREEGRREEARQGAPRRRSGRRSPRRSRRRSRPRRPHRRRRRRR